MKKRMNLSIKLLIPLLAIAIFSVYSFAASVAVSTTTVQSQDGVLLNVTGGFTVASNGFLVVQSASTASAQPFTWANGGTCQTALTAGDWYYSFTLTIATSGAQASHTYTVTVSWNTGSAYQSLGTLQFTTLSTITPGQTMNIYIDTALTSFSAPAAMTITVA